MGVNYRCFYRGHDVNSASRSSCPPAPPPLQGEEFNAYLTALPSAVLAIDTSLAVRFLNPAAERLLGIGAPQSMDKPITDLSGCTELAPLCERVFASGESLNLYDWTLRLPLNHRTVNLHLTPVAGAEQLLITIDKASHEPMSASERAQEATRAAGVMAAMLAHEVKNPLSGIRGAAQLLKEDVIPEQQALTDLICMETDRIRDLLAQVEIFAEGAPGARQPVNIHEVLRYVLSIAQNGFATHIAFHERYDPSLPEVIGHRDLLVQLFLNLVKNAAEALKDRLDGTITFTTVYRSGYRSHREERVKLSVGVSIEDNGPGIPEDVRPHLFEPFVSSKEQGRGLGLAIVAKIAADLGAVVELDPELDGGTRFTVWLPVTS